MPPNLFGHLANPLHNIRGILFRQFIHLVIREPFIGY